MKKNPFALFLFILISSLIYGQNNELLHTTTNPEVQVFTGFKAEITSISLTEKSTLIKIKFESKGRKKTFIVFSSSTIRNANNRQNLYRIISFDIHQLNTRYNLGKKGGVTEFSFVFERIAPGIELIDIDFGGYSWKGVKIKNPDDHPKTNWTENKLKDYWTENGHSPLEGIYENTSSIKENPKYTLALKKEASGYNLIYLSGAIKHSTWKAGDIKAFLSETAKPNLFKVKWYMSNKSIYENLLISFEKGFMKIAWSNPDGTKRVQRYLKLYPTAKSYKTKASITSGTGFALSSDGFIVTNQHIINNKKVIRIRGVNGNFSTTYNAKVVIEDKKNNVAILKIEDANFKGLDVVPYTFNKIKLALGEEVYCIGYSEGAKMRDEIKLTRSMVSSNVGFQRDITTNQISAIVQSGNGGGPLLNLQGEIVGIINTKNYSDENASYAIKINYLMNLIQMVDSEIKLSNLNLISNKNFPSQVQLVKEFVYIIETE